MIIAKAGLWFCTGDLDPESADGFVYIIIDLDTNRKYIGKKNFRGKGKLNKGKPSDWKKYVSSSKYLKALIAEKGIERFRFAILEQYYTTGGLSFAETWSQVVCETPSKNDEFMNRFIDKVTWKVTEGVTARHKKRLREYLKRYPFKGGA